MGRTCEIMAARQNLGMAERTHQYAVTTIWTGNRGKGTSNYRAYSRDHEISGDGKQTILGSSDPAFLGDPARHNPEEMLLASLSACHMLWYLHLCTDQKISVVSYEDHAEGVMQENADGSGQFAHVTLNPTIIVADTSDIEAARELHANAHNKCFIARSVNFPVHCRPTILSNEDSG